MASALKKRSIVMNAKSETVGGETAVWPTSKLVPERKYQGLFEASPVSLWEEDFSGVKQFIENLRANGISDFRAHFDAHSEDVTHCISLINVINFNAVTLDLYNATSKQQLLDNLPSVFGVESFDLFKEELILIAEGKTSFEAEGINYTLDGQKLNVIVRLSIISGFEESLAKVIVSIFDVTKQRQAEAALRLQATALAAVENAVVITDPHGAILWLNPAFTTLTGYTAAEAIGQNPRLLKSGKNDDAFYTDLWQTITSGQVWECEELINRRKDGSLYYEHMVITPMKDEDGRVINYIAVKEDVTERKKMEMRLRRQLQEEELLRRITAVSITLDELPDAMTKICLELAKFCDVPLVSFSLIDPHAMLADILGAYIAPNLIADGLFISPLPELVPPDGLLCEQKTLYIENIHTAPRFESVREILASFSNHSALLLQVKVSEQTQGMLVFETVASRSFAEEDLQVVFQVVAYIEHALRRIQAEKLVQKEQNFAQQVMKNLGQGLIILEPDWTINCCNPAVANLLGYDESDINGRSFVSLIGEEVFAQMPPISEAERREKRSVREINLKRSDGETISVLLTAVPRAEAFETEGAICVLTDLTAQKKIARALAEARDEAIEASRLKSEFLANMSHEIRTPLNAVIGMTDLLMDTPLTPDQFDFAQTIHGSGELLLSLINDILDFSKIEAGKMVLEQRPFSLRRCVEEAVDVVAAKAADADLELAYTVDPTLPTEILGDITRIRQILVNLLNNGIKFTERGEVVLCVEQCHQQQALPPGLEIMLRFSVRDTGIGISPRKSKRLFKSFSQVDASTTRKYGGSGLGLAISKQLVQMMGGEIWVDSKLNHGSTFFFTVPTKVVTGTVAPRESRSVTQLLGKRVLIVDDNETNRKILIRQTELWGMLPCAVSSGKEALQMLAAAEPFDLGILDMHMPEMDGVTLAAEICKRHSAQPLPMIMLSSIGDRADFKDNHHFSAFLTKPVKQKLLLDSMMNVLGETAVPHIITPQTEEIDSDMGQKHPLRILLAEDNLINQKVALRILQRVGYGAELAQNGVEVLEMVQQNLYDVVLMDVQMPKMDGVAATQQIQKMWPLAKRPYIIAMTAHALSGDREKYLAAGMNDYISKPVRIQELVQALKQVSPLVTQ